MKNDPIAPPIPYEPDESYMESRFARPIQTEPKRETFVAGDVFNGISREEADRLRQDNTHRRPVRVKEER